MNERKAVFFDVDGTLFKQGKNVPKSTIRAIAKIRENGHLAFVCTGRSRVMVPKTPILDIGFDGVVAACGMYADYQGKLLFAEEMRQEVLDDILPVLQRTETMYILEGTEYIYYDENSHLVVDINNLIEYSNKYFSNQSAISILKINIAKEHKLRLTKALYQMNITSETMYPGLQGLAQSVRRLREGLGDYKD